MISQNKHFIHQADSTIVKRSKSKQGSICTAVVQFSHPHTHTCLHPQIQLSHDDLTPNLDYGEMIQVVWFQRRYDVSFANYKCLWPLTDIDIVFRFILGMKDRARVRYDKGKGWETFDPGEFLGQIMCCCCICRYWRWIGKGGRVIGMMHVFYYLMGCILLGGVGVSIQLLRLLGD